VLECWSLNPLLRYSITPLLLLLAAACAPAVVPIDREEMARLQNEREIRVVAYAPPRFLYQAPTRTIGGGGQVYAIDAPLADPVNRVRDIFLQSLEGHLGAARLIQTEEPLLDDDVKVLAKKLGGGVVLDFRTITWGLLSGQSVARPYQIAYVARARFLRLETGRVLWQGQCQYDGRDPGGRLEHFDTSPDVLEKKFSEAANVCAKTLLAQFPG